MMKKLLAIIMLAFLTSSCFQQEFWTLTDDMNRIVKSKSFEITAPDDWVRYTNPQTFEFVEVDGERQAVLLESMAITKDGLALQSITITRRYPDNSFPTIKKKSRATMLPPEVADLYVSELRKRSGLERLKVLSNKPAKIGGKRGFKLTLQYKNDDGLRIRMTSYGFVDKTGFYTVSYLAPYLYYFDRDYKKFTNVVHSFTQLKGAQEPPPELSFWLKMAT